MREEGEKWRYSVIRSLLKCSYRNMNVLQYCSIAFSVKFYVENLKLLIFHVLQIHNLYVCPATP